MIILQSGYEVRSCEGAQRETNHKGGVGYDVISAPAPTVPKLGKAESVEGTESGSERVESDSQNLRISALN